MNQEFKQIYKTEGFEHIFSLLKKFIVIKENIKGTSIHFQRKDRDNIFYKGSSKKELSIFDRTIHSIYEPTIQKINDYNGDVPYNYRFCFRYIPEKSEIVLEEIRVIESNTKIRFIEDPSILNHWCKEFGCDGISTIFFGRFKLDTIHEILDSLEDLGSKIYKILNIEERISESLTIKFLNKNNADLSYKITKVNRSIKNYQPSDIYSIVLQDSLSFLEGVNLDYYQSDMGERDHRILDIICKLYIEYIKNKEYEFAEIEDLNPATFSKNNPNFNINLQSLDLEVRSYIKSSRINKDIFRLFLGNFIKGREKTTNLITKNDVYRINKISNKIKDIALKKNKTMDSIPTFEDYFKNRYSKNFINEGKLDLNYTDRGLKKVNILVGRFQPPTLGHIKVLEQLYKQNGLPCVVITVVSSTGKNQKFNPQLMKRIWNDIKREYSFIEDIRETKTAFIDQILNSLRPEYEPVLWGTGTDRLKSYQRFIDIYGEEANILPEFDIYEIKRTGDNISATKVRNSLKNDDLEEFKSMTPKSEHKYYEKLRSDLK